ncbi:hypothetical protein QFI91_01960 [Raoultella sp. WB_B2P2-3]|uniref:hypothetical protein n=1 Tax=Raoultella scottii TaxID=3040937 RepID=UPI002F93E283
MNYNKVYGKELNITVANDLKGLCNLKMKNDVSTPESTIKPHLFQFTQFVPLITGQTEGKYVSIFALYSRDINLVAEYQAATVIKDSRCFYPIPSAIVKHEYKDDEYICGCGCDECCGCGHDL